MEALVKKVLLSRHDTGLGEDCNALLRRHACRDTSCMQGSGMSIYITIAIADAMVFWVYIIIII